MYRYSSTVRGGYGTQKQNRLLQLFALILAITVIILIILLSSANSFKSNYESSTVKLIKYEIAQASSQLNSLSRTGGTSTSTVLGKMRQHIYAVQTVVEQEAELNGKLLISSDTLTNVLIEIDSFDSKRQTGQPTIEQQTKLTNMLSELTTAIETYD